MMNGYSADASYVIVGAGVFGTSTALHLIRKHPSANITLVDREPFPCQVGASWDWNKAIRADYTELLYMKLALEAKKYWRSDPLFRRWYHEDGMFWIADSDLAQTIVDHFKDLNVGENCKVVSVEEAKKMYGGVCAEGDYRGVPGVLVNTSSGWAEAKYCLKDVIQAAVDAGVNYKAATVESLQFDENGSCTGVRTSTGDTLTATKTILCTGAATAKLLADSAPDREELQVGDRMMAAAIFSSVMKLDADTAAKFQVPVCCQDVLPGRGGCVPPNPERELKFWCDLPFKNTVKHSSGRLISMPPLDEPHQGQWNVPPIIKHEIEAVNRGLFGSALREYQMEQHRICWEAVTPNLDFMITRHPHCDSLFIATGGSFHGWKFLPVIGKYVVQLLEGELDDDLAKTWAWDRDNGPDAFGDMWPKRELRDLI